MYRLSIPLGALNAFIAVAAGAFAAHGLKDALSPDYMLTFKTAANYQMMHGIGLIVIGILQQTNTDKTLRYASATMFAGILLFSGSLYALTLSGIKWIGIITPFGGICFLIAWLLVGASYFCANKKS